MKGAAGLMNDEIAARIADAGFDRDYALHVATIQRGELDLRFEG